MRRAIPIAVLAATLLGSGCGRHLDTPLMAAAARGDRAEVEQLVERGVRVGETDGHGCTALIAAARTGQTGAIATLLRLGADPNGRGGVNDWTPMMHAIHKGRRKSVAALLDGGADPNAKTRRGLTALNMAAGYGDAGTVRLLLARGADPYDGSSGGSAALAAAVSGTADIDRFTLGHFQTETVQALLKAAPDLRLPAGAHGRGARLLAWWGNCSWEQNRENQIKSQKAKGKSQE